MRGLRKAFAAGGVLGRRRPVVALDQVAFSVGRGEAVALVGESGSGKSTVARVLLRLLPPDAGELLLEGRDVLASEPGRASLSYRSRVQMVFQDPFGSLNPAHSVGHHLARPLLRHGRARGETVRARSLELLRIVGLEPAEELVDRHPHELSGGQRQRVAIARALAVEPDVLVADEPTSMLDVSIRSGVLALLGRLKRERRLSIVLITHDLAAARLVADRILVLYRGRLVEDGPAGAVVDAPAHPYTRALLASAAHAAPIEVAPGRERSDAASGAGCPFAPRCPEVLDVCLAVDPAPRPAGERRRVRCHLYAEEPPARAG